MNNINNFNICYHHPASIKFNGLCNSSYNLSYNKHPASIIYIDYYKKYLIYKYKYISLMNDKYKKN